MSKILITGNGFDLFHHLPTKYGHFMAIMMTIEESNFSNDVSFEDLFGHFFKEKFQSDYEAIAENYNISKSIFLISELNEIKYELQSNHFYMHFRNVLQLDTWIDFEMEIENILQQLTIVFDASRDGKTKANMFRFSEMNIVDNFIVFDFLKWHARDVLIINEDYLDLRTKKIDETKVLNLLVDSLKQFTLIFNKYLVYVVDKFLDEKQFKYTEVDFHLIDEIYTFNYTNVLEKLYNIKNDKIVYLHGKSNKSNIIQNLIFGISDIPEGLKHSKIFNFTKYYQKIRNNNNCRFIQLPSKENDNFEETVFYVIGHSLDESDKKYVFDLFRYLESDKNKYSRICVFYFSENDYDNKLNNLIKIIGEDVIVEMNKSKRLYFERLTPENLQMELLKTLKPSKDLSPKLR